MPNQIQKTLTDDVIVLERWKGKDIIEIRQQEGDFILIEHRKDKETKKVKGVEHIIPKKNVFVVWDFIKTAPIGVTVTYKQIVSHLVDYYNLAEKENITKDIMITAFNGGRYRSRVYFPYYYFPLKIMETLKMIKYLGKGGVVRLSDDPLQK